MLLCFCHQATKISLAGVTQCKNSSRMEVDIALSLTDIIETCTLSTRESWKLVCLTGLLASRYCPFHVVT